MPHPVELVDFVEPNSYLIEASAGTGKTWTIERLFIKAVLQRTDLTLEQFLVVTFTNDATLDLKLRIYNYCNKLINFLIDSSSTVDDIFIDFLKANYDLDIVIVNLKKILYYFDNTSIYTIHSFCKKIIIDNCIYCNIPVPFKLHRDKSHILKQFIKNYIRKYIINSSLQYNFNIVMNNIKILLNSTGKYKENNDIENIVSNIAYIFQSKQLIIFTGTEFVINCVNMLTNPDISFLANEQFTSDANSVLHFYSSITHYLLEEYNNYYINHNELEFNDLVQIVSSQIKVLSNHIVDKYPIVFIDEFQDTDFCQWNIFSNTYNVSNPIGILVAVGDPKQSIYSFRNSDINTYLDAKHQIKNIYQLTENHRSHINIISFLNALFKHQSFGEQIDYSAIIAKSTNQLNLPSKTILSKFLNSTTHTLYDEQVQIVTVQDKKDISHMLAQILLLIKVDSNLASKIAILVTNHKEAQKVADALNHYKISTNYTPKKNVFSTQTADNMLDIFQAIIQPTRESHLKLALTTNIFNIPYYDLNWFLETGSKELTSLSVVEFFSQCNALLVKNNIISIIYKLLEYLNKVNLYYNSFIVKYDIINMFHIAELITKYCNNINPWQILHWFKIKILGYNDKVDLEEINDEIIRQDEDDSQVTIITHHKAKGLEFDIVFCPFFKRDEFKVNGKPVKKNIKFISCQGKIKITDDILSEDLNNKSNEETHRLNYVALTRAKSRLYIYLYKHEKNKNSSYKSNYAPVLCHKYFGMNYSNSNDTSHILFDYNQLFSTPSSALKQSLSGVVCYTATVFSDEELSSLISFKQPAITHHNHYLAPYLFKPAIVKQSYSKLMYDNHEFNKITEDNNNYTLPILKLLKGKNFGLMVHFLCEHYPLDKCLIAQYLDKYLQVDEIEHSDLIQQLYIMVKEIFLKTLFLNTTLHSLIGHCIREMTFNLRIVDDVNIKDDVTTIIAKYYGAGHIFVKRCKQFNFLKKGFLKGIIDLVIYHKKQFYILDYKTNVLSNYTSCSNPLLQDNPLVIDISNNAYFIQYLLYLVALYKYLQVKLNLTNIAELLGGVIYYYVRGNFLADNVNNSLYFDDICVSMIVDLTTLFYND